MEGLAYVLAVLVAQAGVLGQNKPGVCDRIECAKYEVIATNRVSVEKSFMMRAIS